jgi:adenine-specific DNA-methyltransferase
MRTPRWSEAAPFGRALRASKVGFRPATYPGEVGLLSPHAVCRIARTCSRLGESGRTARAAASRRDKVGAGRAGWAYTNNSGTAVFCEPQMAVSLTRTSWRLPDQRISHERPHKGGRVPTLEFKGKSFVYAHHLSVPFRELLVDAKKSLPSADGPSLDDNLIIHGDNLEGLKALLPKYAAQIDVIYIDPPYNTGKDDWRYNDNVNSPLMKSWLGSVVSRDDMERDDKWLSMMWPRVTLLRELLSFTGVLFMSIDDNELHYSKSMLEEIFGEGSWLGTIVWKNATDNNPTRIAIEHEYIHVFARSPDLLAKEWKAPFVEVKEAMLEKQAELLSADISADTRKERYRSWYRSVKAQLGPLQGYDSIDAGGIFTASRSVHNPGRQGYDWELMNPLTEQNVPKPMMGYRFPESTRDELLAADRIIFSPEPDQLIRLKVYLSDYKEKMPGVIEIDGRRGANELRELSKGKSKLDFKNPKAVGLLEWLLSYTTAKDSIVLDSFAGSGTTAHAVLALNQADGGSRKFILLEAEDYADKLTAERVRLAAKGVAESKDEAVRKGLGGSFTYCELGEPMDMERFFDGATPPAFDQVARYVAYTATGATLNIAKDGSDHFIGEAGGYRLHLIYRADVGFMRSDEAMLDMATAERIAAAGKASGKPILVFAAGKYMGQKQLTAMGLTFCQLPYAIHRMLPGDGDGE